MSFGCYFYAGKYLVINAQCFFTKTSNPLKNFYSISCEYFLYVNVLNVLCTIWCLFHRGNSSWTDVGLHRHAGHNLCLVVGSNRSHSKWRYTLSIFWYWNWMQKLKVLYDIHVVILLWFCPSTCLFFMINLVNKIETKPFCATLSNLADMLTMVRGRTLLILEVKVTMDIQCNLSKPELD